MKNNSFIKDWCLEIISLLSKEYSGQDFFNHKIDEINNADDKSLQTLHKSIHQMVLAESNERQKKINDSLREKFGKTLQDVQPLIRSKKTQNVTEYAFIKDFCITVLEYVASKSDKSIKESYKSVIDNWNNFFVQGEYRGFKEGYRDTLEITKSLSSDHYQALHDLLLAKYGKGLYDIESDTKKLANKIIKRGRIKSNEEWRLINEIANDTTQQEYNIETLNALLLNYEMTN